MSVAASVVADSISPEGNRLTTLEVTMHRFVLAEFNTHRVFSRNSASSRAIPIEKQISRVLRNPAKPVEFGTNQSGMQAGVPLSGMDADMAAYEWCKAARLAVEQASKLRDMGVHKQITNRLLEPFMWHTVIVSSTDWDGFYRQRVSPLAQPEIKVAALAMLEAYEASEPVEVGVGEWHTPFVFDDEGLNTEQAKQISAARCARVSYLTHDGKRDIEKDLELFGRLVSADPPHASPLEHVATPDVDARGNFTGWGQLRHKWFPDW